MNLERSKEFVCAIRGYHYYRRYWTPIINENLNCLHDRENPFDVFAIKTCQSQSFEAVGHLPREISRATKFLLDRGALVTATISSNNYRRSPLVQGGLEIPCKITIKMPAASVKNIKILEKYMSIVGELYTEPEQEIIMGSIVFDSFPGDSTQETNKSEIRTKKQPKKKETVMSKDIRSCFAAVQRKENQKPNERETSEDENVIIHD